MDSEIDRSVAGPKFLTALFGTFAGVALLLACGGIYGSMLYTVNQRKREMGIRLALGADPGRVVRLVLRRGLVLTALGVGIGSIAALAASRLLTDLVWGIEPDDPLTLASVGALLGVSALLACLGSAWGAGRTDPLWALRAD